MNTQVTERDMRRFASLGFPASVCANGETDAGSLVESTLHALQSPSARLAKAVMMALESLAQSNELQHLFDNEFDEDVRRRLGYLAEHLSQSPTTSELVANRLADVAQRLAAPDDRTRPPLTFMAKINASLLRLKMRRADETSRRWQVFGNLELPEPAVA